MVGRPPTSIRGARSQEGSRKPLPRSAAVVSYRPMLHANHQETGIQRAHRLFREPQGSRKTKESLRRIVTKLSTPIVAVLDREDAPLRVCRWVAWGKWAHNRTMRLALALFLRRPVNPLKPAHATSEWGWGEDVERGAAERVFRTTSPYVRLVKAGALVEHGAIPTHDQLRVSIMGWDNVWPLILREVSSLDRDAFMRQIKNHIAASPRYRRCKKRKVKLRDAELAYLDALDTLKRGVLRGDITINDLRASAMPSR
jgi:hypothetical protein